MYKCLKCGRKFDNKELTTVPQYRGEYQGRAAYENESFCPVCGYDVEYCGEWEGDDSYGGEA